MRTELKFAAAAIGAVALIVGAVVVRDRLDDRGAPRATPLDPSKAEVVVCLDELDTLCAALADGAGDRVRVSTESGLATVGRLSERTPDQFTWVTTAEWTDRAIEARAAKNVPALDRLLDAQSAAHAPLTLVVWADRAAALTNNCAAVMVCTADVAADGWASVGGASSWGAVEFDLRDVDESAASRAALGALAAEHFADDDPPLQPSELSSTDLDDPAFDRRLRALADAVPRQSFTQSDPLQRMLTIGPAAVEMTVASTVDLVARPIPETRSAQLSFSAIPHAAIEVSVVPASDPGNSRALDWLRSDKGITELEKLGYRAGRGDTDLPTGGVVAALAAHWSAQLG